MPGLWALPIRLCGMSQTAGIMAISSWLPSLKFFWRELGTRSCFLSLMLILEASVGGVLFLRYALPFWQWQILRLNIVTCFIQVRSVLYISWFWVFSSHKLLVTHHFWSVLLTCMALSCSMTACIQRCMWNDCKNNTIPHRLRPPPPKKKNPDIIWTTYFWPAEQPPGTRFAVGIW